MALNLPPCPPVLKPIQHYLKIANEHEQRDVVVSYWSRLFALQSGLKIDRKSKESLALLTTLMDWLEKRKKELSENEAITAEIVAQAHIENYAEKLFQWADSEDRSSRFNKNVVKAFYTAGILYDVMDIFGEQPEEILQQKKYAKWKAAYIHNCLKNGEIPIPGPMGGDDESSLGAEGGQDGAAAWSGSIDKPQDEDDWETRGQSDVNDFNLPSTSGHSMDGSTLPVTGAHAPPSTPSLERPADPPVFKTYDDYVPPNHPGGIDLTAEDYTQAQKYCKWAGSALQYEDAPTAIENLQKALKLLTTGQRS